MRPPSIIWFERLFLAYAALSVVNGLIVFSQPVAGQQVGTGLLAFSVGLGLAINLLLWWFAARRASNVARIILTILFALSLASVVFSLAVGTYPGGAIGLFAGLSYVTFIAAIVFAYRPDANAWFRGLNDAELGETFE